MALTEMFPKWYFVRDIKGGKNIHINPANVKYIEEKPDTITFFFNDGTTLNTRHPDTNSFSNKHWSKLISLYGEDYEAAKKHRQSK